MTKPVSLFGELLSSLPRLNIDVWFWVTKSHDVQFSVILETSDDVHCERFFLVKFEKKTIPF